MSQHLHGVETVDVSVGTTQVREVRSGIIGLVGTAPQGEVNKLTICLSSQDDAQFGAVTDEHTIPQALKSLREQGAGMVMVVNVGSDTNAIDANTVIGTTDSEGKRTGIQLLNDGSSIYGYDAKILIAPWFSDDPAVAAALDVMAEKIDAVGYADLPAGIKPTDAIAARGGATIAGVSVYQTQNDRLRYCYPRRIIADPVNGGTKLEPSSIGWAGVRARVDADGDNGGYWTSSSNRQVFGTLGLERIISARIDDPNTEANLLNEAGISTMFKSFGTGFLTWGNRNASYPVNNDFDSFEQVRRTKDMIKMSIHQSSLPFVDSDIKQPQIEAIVAFVDEYLRSLIMRGAIVGGKAFFDKARNPASQLSQGQIRIGYKFTPIVPMERITYEREVTGEYLLDLKSVNMGAI